MGLLVWAVRAYPKGHLVRKGAVATTVLIVIEALIGAGLVLLELVAYNVSIARAYWMAAHLINTFLLLAALTLTAWWASGGRRLRLRGQGRLGWALGLAVLGVLVVGTSGAITALGDTLVLGGGLTPEASPVVATLVGLRIYHPLLALVAGLLVVGAAYAAAVDRPTPRIRRLAWTLVGLYALQLGLGLLNVYLRAPVALQLIHLLLSHLLWITLLLLGARALSVPPQPAADLTTAGAAASGSAPTRAARPSATMPSRGAPGRASRPAPHSGPAPGRPA